MKLPIVCEDKKYAPSYSNESDACMDLKIVVKGEEIITRTFNNKEYTNTENSIWLFPNEKRIFSTGIKVAVPHLKIMKNCELEDNYWSMKIYPRSSTGVKLNCALANTIGIIDAGYRDEVKLAIVNNGLEPVELQDVQRVCQFELQPVYKIELEFVEDDENFRDGDRGGGYGSTGLK